MAVMGGGEDVPHQQSRQEKAGAWFVKLQEPSCGAGF